MKMTGSEFRGYVTGLVLGDATISQSGASSCKRAFTIVTINEEFAFDIRQTIIDNLDVRVRLLEREPHTGEDGVHHQGYFVVSTKAHPYFNKMYGWFYNDDGSRRISQKALDKLTPAGIANWYMSDGYVVNVGKTKGKIVDRRIEIATDRYPEKDVDRAIEYFETTYGYKCHKVRRKPGVYRIRFSLLSAQNLFLMIKPYISEGFEYKLNMNYDYQPKWMSDEYYEYMISLK